MTRMKGQNGIFCQPTIASICDREPQQISTRATGRRPLLLSFKSRRHDRAQCGTTQLGSAYCAS